MNGRLGAESTSGAETKYMTRSSKTVRGMEARTRLKMEKEGWEFVSQTQGKVSSELTFRRPAPKTPWLLYGIIGGVLVLVFGIVIVMNVVTGGSDAEQEPAPAPTRQASVEARPTSTPQASATPTSAPEAPAQPVIDTTVDALLEQLNSPNMGGMQLGDRFRFTGELFMSDLWMTGAAGEYTVLFKAQGGTQDLMVFVDEADAAQWTDGTQVEIVVESVEATISGETTSGWLRAISSTTLP